MENNQTMKASELRIGNLIASSGNKKDIETWVIGKVNSISSLDSSFEQIEVETSEAFEWFFRDDYFGIPLTEEWLLRMGFKPDFGTYLLKTNRGIVVIEEDLAEISFSGMQRGFDAPCKYVHQLQNLIFALTNQELEIKES